MARHPPVRHRVKQLREVPQALWRRLVNGVAYAFAWLTLWAPGAVVSTVLAGLVALWVWAGTPQSLAQTVSLVRPWVVALDGLEMDDTEASLREGGTVSRLAWSDGQGLRVVVSDLTLGWEWLPLLKAEPIALTLKAGHVTVDDQRPPSPDAPRPPDSLVLPLEIQATVSIDHLTLAGQRPVELTDLQGRYRFEGEDEEARHLIEAVQVNLGSSHYTVEAALQAQAPMTVNATLTGELVGTLPAMGSQSSQPWQGQLKARITGALGTDPNAPVALPPDEASLTVRAGLQDTTPGAVTRRAGLEAVATIKPWLRQPLHALQARVRQLNLAALWPQLPSTLLSGEVQATPPTRDRPLTAQDVWQVRLALTNAASGPLDQGQWPMNELYIQASASAQAIDVTELRAGVAGGVVQGQGRWVAAESTARGALTVSQLNMGALHTGLKASRLAGRADIRPEGGLTQWSVHLAGTPDSRPDTTPAPPDRGRKRLGVETVQASGTWTGQDLVIDNLRLHAAGAQVQGKLTLATTPLGATGQIKLQVPGLQGDAQGQLSADRGQGQMNAQVTDLSAFTRWMGTLPSLPTGWLADNSLAGGARLSAHWRGGWQAPGGPDIQAQLTGERLSGRLSGQPEPIHLKHLALSARGNRLSTRWTAAGQVVRGPLTLDLDTQARTTLGPSGPAQLMLDRLALNLSHTRSAQSVRIANAQVITIQATESAWRVGPGTLELETLPHTTKPNAKEGGTRLQWQQVSLENGLLSTEGQLQNLGLNSLETAGGWFTETGDQWMADAGLQGDLTLQGQWQVAWPLPATTADTRGPLPEPRLQINLQRQAGDLRFQSPEGSGAQQALAAGIEQARLELLTQGHTLVAGLNWASERAGKVSARFQAELQKTPAGWALPAESPLKGEVKAKLPELQPWSPLLAPPGWRAKGAASLTATATGTVGQPQWSGELSGSHLALRSVVEGLEFGNGQFTAHLSGEQLNITRLTLEGAGGAQQGGSLSATGSANWSGQTGQQNPQPRIRLSATADKLRVSTRADRRLTLSGTVSATLVERQLQVRGDLAVDQALFILPDETAPSLDDDVVIRQTQAAAAERARRLDTDLHIDIGLGDKLEVRGQGLKTRLGGKVSLVSTPQSPTLRVLGEVRTVAGSYRAYGQQLSISEGVIRFSGPYDDPGLNILAVRAASAFRDSDAQVVGVRITGSARAPLVKLYANPDLPDSEKLAWLVLGRKASGAGAEAAILQQAALALLSGNGGAMDTSLAGKLGLDDISFRGSSTLADGTVQAAGVALGKRLSERLYMTLETSLNTAVGTVSLFYDVSRRLTLRARAGEENAIDLIFTVPHD